MICGVPYLLSLKVKINIFLSLIDDFSRKVWTIFLKQKFDTYEKFRDWKILIENQTSKKIKSWELIIVWNFTMLILIACVKLMGFLGTIKSFPIPLSRMEFLKGWIWPFLTRLDVWWLGLRFEKCCGESCYDCSICN